jgi:molybdenum cofactor cytidylyltransferase
MEHFCGSGKAQFIKDINKEFMPAAEHSKQYLLSHSSAIILAAGRSERLGNPKQLLQFCGETLLAHTINEAKQSSVQSIIVVLGYEFDLLEKTIDIDGLQIVRNANWQSGIASSINCGITALQNMVPLCDAAILMVCDQPFITASLLNNLIKTQKASGKPIIASKYDETAGIPVLFHKALFPELLELDGDSGAKKIIHKYPDLVTTFPFPKGGIDIDTLSDYEALIK